MSQPPNPFAFPGSAEDCSPEWGMTLRDWFAGQLAPVAFEIDYGNDWGKAGNEHGRHAANRAYAWADALLAARNRSEP